MRVQAEVVVLGKVITPWTDAEGNERSSYSANIMQCNGEIVEKLRLSKTQYDGVVAGKSYIITADYGTGRNGGYLKITNFEQK